MSGYMKRLLLSLCVIALTLSGCHQTSQPSQSSTSLATTTISREEAAFQPFYRIGRDNPNAWRKPLSRVRIITKGFYTLGQPKAKYHMDPDFKPVTKGLDTLNISGSAQYSKAQFEELISRLKKAAAGKDIYVLDLRMESHALLNDVDFSWYGYHNWANKGMSDAAIDADEKTRFKALLGQTFTAYKKTDEAKKHGMTLDVTRVMTEQELVEGAGAHYVRIHAADYSWPQPEKIDQFITFVKSIDLKKSWLHFHCHAGLGRTGIFMCMYDKMRNPELSLKDILTRQALLESKYLLYVEPEDDFQHDLSVEITQMMPLLFTYIEENAATNYQVRWSDYLNAYAKENTSSSNP